MDKLNKAREKAREDAIRAAKIERQSQLLPSESRRLLGQRALRSESYMADLPWQLRGACNDEDPELFFPVGSTGPALQQIEEAKAVCRRCPVTDSCLKFALETGQSHGVWGGLSEDEIKVVRRRRARARRVNY